MKLHFPEQDAAFAQSLSAVVRVGDDVWVGGDEGTKVGADDEAAGGALRFNR